MLAEAKTTIPTWDEYFMDLVNLVAARSKDPNTKMGSVLVGPNHEIRSTGYNSFPRGIRDNVPERLEKPEKYLWLEHAERNAIYSAGRVGTATDGCVIYIQIMPCMDCARAIIQAGIVEIVIDKAKFADYREKNPRWSFDKVLVMLDEAGVRVREV